MAGTVPAECWSLIRERGGTPFDEDEVLAAEQELTGFVDALTAEGVTVVRPDPVEALRPPTDREVTLLGRGSQSINSGGEKIFPEEVEAAVKSHPAVYDAVVVGVPDERWGQRVAAVVQPRAGTSPELASIQDHCRTKIAGYKVPRELPLVARMQRSPSGKADYPWARKVAIGQI